jgi:hypothetical protein
MRDIALRAIQDILAQLIKLQLEKMLFNLIGGAAGGLGGAAGAAGAAGASEFPVLMTGSALPGFASGGSFDIVGRMGTDQNVLSLNGLPIARVSHGERLSIGNDNQRSGGQFIFNNYAQMSASEARKTGMQAAAGYQSEMARARSKGIS